MRCCFFFINRNLFQKNVQNNHKSHIKLYKFIKKYIFCQIYLEDSKKCIIFAAEIKIAQKYTYKIINELLTYLNHGRRNQKNL